MLTVNKITNGGASGEKETKRRRRLSESRFISQDKIATFGLHTSDTHNYKRPCGMRSPPENLSQESSSAGLGNKTLSANYLPLRPIEETSSSLNSETALNDQSELQGRLKESALYIVASTMMYTQPLD